MRIICLKDDTIPEQDVTDAFRALAGHYREHAKDAVEYTIENRHFKRAPYEEYWGGQRGLKKRFVATLARDIVQRYGKHAFDHVVIMVHPDNWTPDDDGIWGWNLAGARSGLETQQVRFDPGNPANTLGTLYHETMHAHDQFIYRTTGTLAERILGIRDWDDEVVHGQHERWQYIRHLENAEALAAIAKPLKRGFAKRTMRHRRRELAKKATKLAGSGNATADAVNALVEWFRDITNRLTRSDQPFKRNNSRL